MVATVSFPPLGQKAEYLVDPGRADIAPGTQVVVESGPGLALGRVVRAPRVVARKGPRLQKIVRPARPADLDLQRQAETREPEAVRLTLRWIRDHGRPWKLVSVTPDGVAGKLTICFASDAREDSRQAAKDLSRILDVRVDLRQVGLRDLSRVTGGMGRCGRELCCASWLASYPAPSIRMAKDQNLALAPDKTAGICGKTLCCLAYEHEQYRELRRWLPKLGKRARTTDGLEGRVVGVDVLRLTFALIDEQGRRVTLPAEAWEGNAGKDVPEPAFERTRVTAPALRAVQGGPPDQETPAGALPGADAEEDAPDPAGPAGGDEEAQADEGDAKPRPSRRRRRRRKKKVPQA